MNRPRVLLANLATLLALAVPLEMTRCVGIGLEPRAARSMPASHACCVPGSPEQHVPDGCDPDCSCLRLPSAPVPAKVSLLHTPSHCPATVVASMTVIPLSSRQTLPRALDLGSPPLPIDLGAHGLRAPPSA